MKTSKSKTVSKPKKVSGVSKTVKGKKTSGRKSVPDEEAIRKKANEIYMERIALGEQGTAEDDWQKAEEILKKKK
jgi:hypothetical protein